MTSSVLLRIRYEQERLSAAERRVAAQILKDPHVVLRSTIMEMAARCDTSQATVARFCRAVGLDGYRALRVEVAAAASRQEAELDRFELADGEIDPSDTAAEVVAKIAFQETQAIVQTTDSLDLAALDAVVAAIVDSPSTDIYGFGSSALTALDLQQKLHRIGMNAYAFSDIHLALPSAAILKPMMVAIAVSHSGTTAEANDALQRAHLAGAVTVAITNEPMSPLGRAADFVLATNAGENRYRSGAMSSRIAQLALVDALFVRIAQRRDYDELVESLRLTYESVRGHRVGKAQRGGSAR